MRFDSKTHDGAFPPGMDGNAVNTALEGSYMSQIKYMYPPPPPNRQVLMHYKAITGRVVCLAAVLTAAVVLSLAGCVASPASRSFVSGFSPELSDVNGGSGKMGIAKSVVWIGIFGGITDERMKSKSEAGFIYDGISGGFSYPPIATAAKNGGITRIASVEYYHRWGLGGLWQVYMTIVTGE